LSAIESLDRQFIFERILLDHLIRYREREYYVVTL